MSDKCPKCGAACVGETREKRPIAFYWECGTKRMFLYSKHVHQSDACRIAELEYQLNMYKTLFNQALDHVDRAFQINPTNPSPILSNYRKLGEDKFAAVERLAKDFRELTAENERLRNECDQCEHRAWHEDVDKRRKKEPQ